MKQTVMNPVHLLQKIVHLPQKTNNANKNKNKKQSVHKHFVWDPCSHHGGVKLKKRGFIYIISQDQGPSKRTQH